MAVELCDSALIKGKVEKCIGILLRAPIPLLSKGLIIERLHARDFKQRNPDRPVLTITMPCGVCQEYSTYDDIPDVDIACPCGNPSHWIIKYEIVN